MNGVCLMGKLIISTNKAPSAIGPYSQAVTVDNKIYTSGLLGINPETGKMVEGIEEQTKQALENGKAILEAAGSGMSKVFKTVVFITNMENFARMNAVYADNFAKEYPARSTVAVELIEGALVEIELIATLT